MTSISCKNNRSTNITIAKLIFVICIVILHYFVPWSVNNAFMAGGYIYVEFFFILQGFYIEDVMRGLDTVSVERAYVITRLKKFFTIAAVQAAVLLAVEWLFYCETRKDYVLKGVGTLYQISFVSILLKKNLLNNGTMWFLSAYVIAGCLAICIIKRHGDVYRILSVIISAMIYNYIIESNGSIDAWWKTGFGGALPYGLPRAFAGISLGYFCRGVYEYLCTIKSLQLYWMKTALAGMGGGISHYQYKLCYIHFSYGI